MTNRAISGSALASMALTGVALAALALPAAASAQVVYSAPMSDSEVRSLPPEYRTGPAVADYSETSVDQYGVETITRTRRIETSAPYPGEYVEYEGESHQYGYAPAPAYGYAPAAAVFERDQWLDECERRTSGRGNREKGGIIGGLLGAIAGGIIGNRVADSERLEGVLQHELATDAVGSRQQGSQLGRRQHRSVRDIVAEMNEERLAGVGAGEFVTE